MYRNAPILAVVSVGVGLIVNLVIELALVGRMHLAICMRELRRRGARVDGLGRGPGGGGGAPRRGGGEDPGERNDGGTFGDDRGHDRGAVAVLVEAEQCSRLADLQPAVACSMGEGDEDGLAG